MSHEQTTYANALAKKVESIECLVTTLSPIHIGNGEDLSPTQYVIDDQRLYILNELNMISALNEAQRKELNQMCNSFSSSKGQASLDVTKIQNFMHRHRTTIKKSALQIIPISKELERFYLTKLENKLKSEQAKLEIPLTFHHPVSFVPIIPGSTLKGVFRHGITSGLLKKRSIDRFKHEKRGADVEGQLLNYRKMNEDPFSAIKISDTQVIDRLTGEVIFTRQFLKKETSDLRLKMLKHVITPMSVRKISFTGQIDLNSIKGTELNGVSFKTIFQELNQFYVPIFKKELERFNQDRLAQKAYFNLDANWCNLMIQFLNTIEAKLKDGSVAIIRLGQYAGGESKTWNDLRKIKISKPGTKDIKFGSTATTQWVGGYDEDSILFSLPFGWALIENTNSLLDNAILKPLEDAVNPLLARQNRAYEEIHQIQTQWRNEAKNRKADKEALILKKAEQEALKIAEAKAEENRLALRASLTPEQLSIQNVKERLSYDKKYQIKEQAGVLRGLLRESCQLVGLTGNSELKRELREHFSACCQWWGVDRKKNAKIKELWKQIAESE